MKPVLTGLTTAIVLALLSVSTFGQGPAQTAGLMSVDPTTVAVGYRASNVVGSNVFDSAGIKLGTVDDLIITSADQVPYAVLSVGGFLGMGEKHVLVTGADLKVIDDKIVLAGGTKASLTALPAFTYAK